MSAARGDGNDAVERDLLRLIDDALELPVGERDAFLEQQCHRDPETLRAARALLDACMRAEVDGEFLSGGAADLAEPLVRAVRADDASDATDSVARVADALVGRYVLVHEIGRGGNAVVHLARDVRHGRDVAVKIIQGGFAPEAQRRRFLREIDIAAQLQHPYVVALIDSGDAEGVLYYVMPFVEGESLRHRLDREGALSVDACLALARDVAEALDAAHAAGIVHRDIKPQNILLGGAHPLVADFGIALALEATGDARLTEHGIAVGTPAYMSPEQATASERIDGRSDVYSLACVVYEMLTGEVPYPGVTAQAMRAKHLHAPVPDLTILRPTLPASVQRVMARALAKAPADRFETSGDFIAELARAATESPNGARHPSAWWSHWWPGTRIGAWTATTLLLAVLGGLAWSAVGAARARRLVSRTPSENSAATAGVRPFDQRRIAVLYFDNLTGDEEIGRIARGLTEDLIDALSAVRGLRVISPNGVRPFRDRSVAVDSIGRSLSVGTVVGGSLSASATVIRATVRLVDPRSGEQLQSRALEVPRSDALALRQEVVTQVAAFLRLRLGEEIRLRSQRSQTGSLAAWERVRRADELVRDGVAASIESRDDDARDLFLRADSLYALAERLDRKWTAPVVGRGWVAVRLGFFSEPNSASSMPSAQSRDSAQGRAPVIDPMVRFTISAIQYAERALQLSTGASDALALRGFARQLLGRTRPEPDNTLLTQAEGDLRAALAERPDDARSWYALGEQLSIEGRYEEAATALNAAYEADAYLTEAPAVVSESFFASLNLERFDQANQWCELGVARYPGDPRFAGCRLIQLGWTGRTVNDVSRGWREVERIERSDSSAIIRSQWGFFRLMVAAAAARSGRADSALSIVRAVQAASRGRPERPGFPVVESYVRLLAGDRRGAAELLAREIRVNPQSEGFIVRSPWFRVLVADSTLARTLQGQRAGPQRSKPR